MRTLLRRKLSFTAKTRVKNPDVIVEETDPRFGTPVYNARQVKGDFYRVIPSNEVEVAYMRNLQHRRDKYAPAKGNGILVRVEAIDAVSNLA